jgi:hypothetical protein
MSDTQKRYEISKEFAEKIDKEFDEMFANAYKGKGAYYIWNAALEDAALTAEKYEANMIAYEIRMRKKK